MSKKSESKHNRKVRKCMKILEKFESGIYKSESPTKNLLVGNGGLACGFDYEQLFHIFNEYGCLEDIILIPDRPYSFVVFQEETSAESAFNLVNNKLNLPLYLIFTKEVPDVRSHFSESSLPPGLVVVEDFVSEDEEKELLKLIPECDQMLKTRSVQHFGYEFDYATNNMFGSKPLLKKIPPVCNDILLRMVKQNLVKALPDQLTINHYLPGQGIPPHVDTHSAFEDKIVSLSLGSQVVMEFRHSGGAHIPVYLPRRSLLVMTGESRYLWTHGITCRKNDIVPVKTAEGNHKLVLRARETRTSFTFRKIQSGTCTCGMKDVCDKVARSSEDENNTKEGIKSLNLEDSTAEDLEKLHVHKVYNDIAEHFSDTRYKPWPKIDAFLNIFPQGSLLYDVGCGNGKYLGRHPSMYQIGCDMSANLLQICHKRNLEVFEANILSLPFRPSTADGVLCIAVLHHLSTLERRLKALKEISDLLSVGGQALVYVWALEQDGPNGPSNYVKPSRNRSLSEDNTQLLTQPKTGNCEVINVLDSVALPVHVNRTQFAEQDMLVPWKSSASDNKTRTVHRFYHLFQENELLGLVENIKSLDVVESYYDKGNWCVKVRKVIVS